MSDEYDVVVLGTGAAGLSAALTATAAGASVGLFDKAPTVGGTTAVSGGVVWVPAHEREDVPDPPTAEEALRYLRAHGDPKADDELVQVFVASAAETVRFIEDHSAIRFSVAEGFPDYRPELPGGRPQGGRSFNPSPMDFGQLGEWASRVTAFPRDFSDVGFDAETRRRMWGDRFDDLDADIRVSGAALVGGLLRALLDRGVVPRTDSRAVAPILSDGAVTGVVIEQSEGRIEVSARHGVVIATGGFEWEPSLIKAFLRGPMNGAISPPNNTGDGLRIAMRAGACLGNMGEAWWTQVVKLPGDVFEGHERSRSVRLERTRPGSIMVNRHGRRFCNEAADYNSLGGAFHRFDAERFQYENIPAFIVFDGRHLQTYGFLHVSPGGEPPDWFHRSRDLAELAGRIGVDPDGLTATVADFNDHAARGHDPEFGRGESAYDAWWGDPAASTRAGRSLGPLDQPPYYAVPVGIGCSGTKGGPRTDRDARVLDLDGHPIPGLYAAGNAMAAPTGMSYGGAGGTIAPALVFGRRAAAHAVAAPTVASA